MEGSSEVCGWNEEECEAMHMYDSAEVHAFQPYNPYFQQHVGMPQFFQPSVGNVIPPPLPSISEMVSTHLKRKVVQDDEDDDVQIVTPSALKRKTTAKKVTKKIMKKEKEKDLTLAPRVREANALGYKGPPSFSPPFGCTNSQ